MPRKPTAATTASIPMPPSRPFHWSPISAVWIVSIAVVILAVLPHQIPRTGRRVLRTWTGAAIVLAIAAWIAVQGKGQGPVLAVALVLLVAGVWTFPFTGVETFAAGDPVLNKDRVRTSSKEHRWFDEKVQNERPTMIQERTSGPMIQLDDVDTHTTWHDEEVKGEHPRGIQERPVGLAEYSGQVTSGQ